MMANRVLSTGLFPSGEYPNDGSYGYSTVLPAGQKPGRKAGRITVLQGMIVEGGDYFKFLGLSVLYWTSLGWAI